MITVPEKFVPRNYKQCKTSVLDNIADNFITFDLDGNSNYYHKYQKFVNQPEMSLFSREKKFHEIINKIKADGKGKKYDCLLGLSGGADSSYLAYLAKIYELKPLVVHFDYGWNTDFAISNIEKVTKKLDFELFTYVIDWDVIRDLQKSYYKASVVDLDVPADHTITGSIFSIARKMGIKYLLNGSNYQTEYIMPHGWNYQKTDLTNLKNIHRIFGELPFKNIPTNGVLDQIYFRLRGHVSVPLLQYIDYKQKDVLKILKEQLDWRDYGSKHFENVFTRFYQGYVLPNKFGIDKRKPHLSNLIFSGQMSKEEALEELSKPTYDLLQQSEDKKYVAKKLGFTSAEFDSVLHQENAPHEFYGTDDKLRFNIYKMSSFFLPKKYIEVIKDKVLRKVG
jgi:N-acetyl sugar amidotransferase